MMLSKKCVYGILATVYVGLRNDSNYVPIRNIAKQLDIPFYFLTKILQVLTAQQIMVSYRGPNGGVMLVKKPEEISIYNIILAIDGKKVFTDCILGLPGCGESTPCPLHSGYSDFKNNIENIFKKTTIEKLAAEVRQHKIRITDLEIIK